MKERTKGFVAGFLLCALLIGLGIPVGAATYKKAVEVYYRNIKVTVDSQEVTPKDAQGNKVEPFIMNGTTYLPVRGIASALGMDVRWDNATSTVSLYTSGNGAVDEDSIEFGSDLMPFNVDEQTTASYLHELIDDLIAGERYW